ncbi:hypothetical protein SAMN05216275_14150 [Streptosporangium canum]|uniref:Uncharacterized protein n=1 Tax=Streptosporangium canum TaxID=324952 RepID=A0A1I4DIV6_9ACTN|nr:hypothetical protein [Streptosporangium canum]SFK92357.1 hypothetical protein SAMN05216275_14150 [Streptosporangium canum]
MTQDHPADRTAELEQRLHEANAALACFVQMAGGQVIVPGDLFARAMQRQRLIQVDTAPGGNRTYTLEGLL